MFIAEYQNHGFQGNQDVPGNFYWEELYNASPDAKVILTVRDSEDDWSISLQRFWTQEAARAGNPGHWIFNRIATSGLMGPKLTNMVQLSRLNNIKNGAISPFRKGYFNYDGFLNIINNCLKATSSHNCRPRHHHTFDQ